LGLNYTGNSFVFQEIPRAYFANKPIVKLAIHAGSSTNAHSVMALAADGSVYAWGYNGYGQLGIGNTVQQNTPVLVPGTGTTFIISDVAIGANVTSSTGICAMIVSNVNNQVLVAGYNGHGALASGNTTNRSTLGYWNSSAGVPIQNAKNMHISGDYPTLAVSTTTGELWTAGYNAHGQLGNNTRTSTGNGYAGRVIVSGVNTVTGVGGYYGNFATLMNDGTIRVWGYNGYGQLGNGGTTDGLTPTNTFTQYAGRTVVKIACSQWDYQTTALLLSDGSIFCAGYNGYSKQGRQNGASNAASVNWAKFLLSRGDVVDLRWQGYNQYAHIEILTSDGKIYSVGYNGNGDLCRGDTTDRYGISNYLL
jgi:alpha-tubulin suppressor-like RCC1 family protein